MNESGKAVVQADDEVVAAGRLRELEGRIRDLERLLGADHGGGDPAGGVEHRPGIKASLVGAVATTGRFRVKVVADTPSVARSNLVEQLRGVPRQGPLSAPG